MKCLQESKEAHRVWNAAGRPDCSHTLWTDRKAKKRAVRSQLRCEFAEDRRQLYGSITENASDKVFYRLINRNRNGKCRQTAILVVEDKEVYSAEEQCSSLASFYEVLATPKEQNHFDNEYRDRCARNCELIEALSNMADISLFTIDEIEEAIKKINTGKASDEYGIAAEHIKYGVKQLLPYLARLFNNILSESRVPEIFKTGIITPVHKKGKDPKLMDNYRGITVTAVIGKIFEYTLLNRMEDISVNQSDLQFGFTKGLSPVMASFIVSEATMEAAALNKPLYLTTLDTQKAFDVVHHQILLNRLYHQECHPKIWTIVKSMYDGLSSRVKWAGEISEQFPVMQGVRQGGILSTHLYKIYINNLLLDLQRSSLGLNIGSTYIGCPTCADDILLLTDSSYELQSMLNIVFEYSSKYRYNTHPEKSTLVIKSTQEPNRLSEFLLGDRELHTSKDTTHLGIVRATKNENSMNIDNRISLARKTLYALMKIGVHGYNGLCPTVSYNIYKIFVIPRLLYGLEALNLNKQQITSLARFHTKVLKQFQGLPNRTATGIVYLLLGALPIEAELHIRQLSFLFTLLNNDNDVLMDLVSRYMDLRDLYPESFMSRIELILEMYELPTVTDISENYSKSAWKKEVKSAVKKYWSEHLNQDLQDKSTLKFCYLDTLQIDTIHPVWSSISNSFMSVKQAVVKVRMLTGTYMLQSVRSKFNQNNSDPTCPLCQLEPEDIQHMITRCPALQEVREQFFTPIKDCVIKAIGLERWNRYFNSRQRITQLIIDCQVLAVSNIIPNTPAYIAEIEDRGRYLCYKLHMKRTLMIENLRDVK